MVFEIILRGLLRIITEIMPLIRKSVDTIGSGIRGLFPEEVHVPRPIKQTGEQIGEEGGQELPDRIQESGDKFAAADMPLEIAFLNIFVFVLLPILLVSVFVFVKVKRMKSICKTCGKPLRRHTSQEKSDCKNWFDETAKRY